MANISLPSLWDDAHAKSLDESGLLLYRSNLLGSDLRITNFAREPRPNLNGLGAHQKCPVILGRSTPAVARALASVR